MYKQRLTRSLGTLSLAGYMLVALFGHGLHGLLRCGHDCGPRGNCLSLADISGHHEHSHSHSEHSHSHAHGAEHCHSHSAGSDSKTTDDATPHSLVKSLFVLGDGCAICQFYGQAQSLALFASPSLLVAETQLFRPVSKGRFSAPVLAPYDSRGPPSIAILA